MFCFWKLGVCGSAALLLSGRASRLATILLDIEQREEGEDGDGDFDLLNTSLP